MKEKVEIKIELSEVTNKCLLHLKEVTDCVNHIYFATNNFDYTKTPLPTDSFQLIINDQKPLLTPEEQKVKTIEWTLKKAFEEFIIGLTKSLIEAYKLLKVVTACVNHISFATNNFDYTKTISGKIN